MFNTLDDVFTFVDAKSIKLDCLTEAPTTNDLPPFFKNNPIPTVYYGARANRGAVDMLLADLPEDSTAGARAEGALNQMNDVSALTICLEHWQAVLTSFCFAGCSGQGCLWRGRVGLRQDAAAL